MGLRMKFNLVLLLAFVIGLGLAAYLSDQILKRNAREEVLQNARIMMESAMGARAYTVQRIQPWPEALALLEKLGAVNNHKCVSS